MTATSALIRRVRAASGMTQEAIATACGVHGISQTSISRWEKGHAPRPTIDQIRAVVAATGADVRREVRVVVDGAGWTAAAGGATFAGATLGDVVERALVASWGGE